MPKIVAPELHHPKLNAALGYTKERAEYLRENAGIDPALLAAAMGVSERWTISFMRRLGLRKMVPASTRARRALEIKG